jgi:NADP-reducing hydrogenase subunit HndB
MGKITIEDLEKIAQDAKAHIALRRGDAKVKITVHLGSCGVAKGAREIIAALLQEIEKHHTDDVIIASSGCAGICTKEPMITVEFKNQAPVKYVDLTVEKVRKIFDDHIIHGKFVHEYAYAVGNQKVL